MVVFSDTGNTESGLVLGEVQFAYVELRFIYEILEDSVSM